MAASSSNPLPMPSSTAPTPANVAHSLSSQFGDIELYAKTLLVLALAVALGALLAYHPSTRRKVSSRTALEQPKTFVMYALIGALVGHIVLLNEVMALVVFGIGGLLRFRTDVGEAKDTGRVILAAIVGICCGVGSYLIAILATAFGWVLIWHLERRAIGSVQILGLDTPKMQASSDAYRELLERAGCVVVSEIRNPKKSLIELVFTSSREVTEGSLRTAGEQLPEETRGVAAWEVS